MDQKVIYVCDRKACNGTCPIPDSCAFEPLDERSFGGYEE